jgi:ABC-2 type transport system ATP-binding protein
MTGSPATPILPAMLTNSLDVAVAERLATNQSGPVIRVRGLRKRYGDTEAVRGIDLEINRGEIFAFLGPNGAGKTTTVEILEGFRTATDGAVEVLGQDPAHARGSWRERIGVVLQESEAEPGLTVRDCLELYAGYYRRPRGVGETLELAGLAEQADQRAKSLSGGQRRRLDVALALVGDPELIFLDEPTTGFDPSARRAAWQVISGLRDLGKTVFLTTHYMEEAERLADRIAVISDGRIVAEGDPRTLGDRHLSGAEITFSLPPQMGVSDLPGALASRAEENGGGRLIVRSSTVTPDLHALAGWALERGVELDDLEVRRPTLEDVYLKLTAERSQS